MKRFTWLLADAAKHADPSTPVATCGAWTLDDLLWHLTEVQRFWTFIITNRPDGPTAYEQPTRTSGPDLVDALRHGALALADALTGTLADEPAWSWAAEQTVGFTIRRQTHEALTHCVDGLIALGLEVPLVAAELAADGVDEIVRVMLEPSAETAQSTGTISLHTTDTDDRWTVSAGQGECTISGSALDLNLWMWGRADMSPLALTGDVDQAAALRAMIAGDTQ